MTSEDEYFESGLWRYDMKPKENMNVLTYVEYEDIERYDEMIGSYNGSEYSVERSMNDLSLYALVSTGFTEEDISLKQLSVALNDLEKTNNIITTIVPLDEIHIFIKYRPMNSEDHISLDQQSYNAIILFDEVEYETLSRMLKDVFDTIEVVNKLDVN